MTQANPPAPAEQERLLYLELRDTQGRPVRLALDEAQARHILEQSIQVFGWSAKHNPLSDIFLKSFLAGLDLADKIEGGA